MILIARVYKLIVEIRDGCVGQDLMKNDDFEHFNV